MVKGLSLLCVLFGVLATEDDSSAFEPAHLAVDAQKPFSGYALVNAFPGVTLDQPVGIVSAPNETNRLFIIERSGVIVAITNLAKPDRTVFLDLRDSTYSKNIETGLLGLAFHPGYRTNGYFFVFRTAYDRNLNDRLSRFSVSAEDPNCANPQETVLIDQKDLSATHNSGDLHFGPDGYLYISVGDEGPFQEDRRTEPLAIDGGLFGGILRIDVDQRPGNVPPNAHPSVIGNYSIPADNPFIGATTFLGQPVDPTRVRTEFYAVGTRNPWRFTIDPPTGKVLVGDVGAGWQEEIDIIKPGANYGFPYWEGFYPGYFTAPAPFDIEWPIFVADHGRRPENASCIIGGIVCRDAALPELEGWYVFGDEGTGSIWKLNPENPSEVHWLASEPALVAFGRDPSTGDVLLANIRRNEIRRLTYTPPTEQHIPVRLSESGIFTNVTTLEPAAGLVPYEINVPFWSDNAIKSRWFGLLNDKTKMGFSPTGNWTFPEGSVWVKHFELEMDRGNPATARRVETRLLIKSGEEILGYTYKWNDAGSDAELVAAIGAEQSFQIRDLSGQIRTQVWQFPSRGDCAACHSKGSGGPLGFNTAQLNLDRQFDGGEMENQLQRIARAGYLDVDSIEPRNLPALAKASDTNQPVEFRAKSYLAANCSQCHRPDGIWEAVWDARWTTPLSEARILNGDVNATWAPEMRVVTPRALETSMIHYRVTHQNLFRMPPIGSTALDESAGELMQNWISGMPDESFTEYKIGAGVLYGSVSQSEQVRLISGIGAGLDDVRGDRLHLLGSALGRNGYVAARLLSVPGAQPGMRSGVMIRADNSTNSATVWIAANAAGAKTLLARTNLGGPALELARSLNAGDSSWMRLNRSGDHIAAFESSDGASWQPFGETDLTAIGEALAGVAVGSGEDWRYATGEFDHLETLSVSMQVIDPTPAAQLPRDITLQANLQAYGAVVHRVDFFADDQLIGSTTAAPWQFKWTNAWAGPVALRAEAFSEHGSAGSESVSLALTAPPSLAHYKDSAAVESDWRTHFGFYGDCIPGVETNLPARASLAISGEAETYSLTGVLPGANGQLPASAWVADDELRLIYRPGNANPHCLTLFFASYENAQNLSISVRDIATGAALDQRTETELAEGRFLSWAARGDLEIRITAISPGRPSLSGVFMDPLAAPTVVMQPIASPFILPNAVVLRADAASPSGAIQRVEFWNGETKLGEAYEPPFEWTWTNALVGQHSISALAVDEFGIASRSTPVLVTAVLSDASAMFIGEDRQTQGDWVGPYGSSGNLIPLWNTNLPASLNVVANAKTYLFAASDTSRASLRTAVDRDSRFAPCYYVDGGESMELRITTRDGQARRMALYFLDLYGPGRAEQIVISDASSGVELDRRDITRFTEGSYLVWNIRGDIKVLLHSLNDYNTVVSAMFFDPPSPTINLTTPTADAFLVAPTNVTLRAEVKTDGPMPQRVEFFADQQRIGFATNTPFEFVWTNVLAGSHTFFARALVDSGPTVASPTITINCQLPPTRVAFTGLNGTNRGEWWRTFGADGFWIPLGPEAMRPYTRVVFAPDVVTHESAHAGSDARGAYSFDVDEFLATSWISPNSLDATIDFLDGREHSLAIYFLDFDRFGSAEVVQLIDPASNAVLDEHALDDIGEGVYLAWSILGLVKLHIARSSDWPATASGVFIGGAIPESQFWWASHFGNDLLAIPQWDGDADADGRANVVEYALGTDPMVTDEPLEFETAVEGTNFVIRVPSVHPAADAELSVETSVDLATWKTQPVGRTDTFDAIELKMALESTGQRFYRLRFAMP